MFREHRPHIGIAERRRRRSETEGGGFRKGEHGEERKLEDRWIGADLRWAPELAEGPTGWMSRAKPVKATVNATGQIAGLSQPSGGVYPKDACASVVSKRRFFEKRAKTCPWVGCFEVYLQIWPKHVEGISTTSVLQGFRDHLGA